MELDALIWRESRFDDSATWVPKDLVSDAVKVAFKERHGRFQGERFVYYLSRSGNITRYRRLGD